MTNLATETAAAIVRSGHTAEDIAFIGSSDGEYAITLNNFMTLADREYDSGYGSQQVATDLVIQFSDGVVMSRDEYDGSESWVWSNPILVSDAPKPIRSLFANDDLVGWASIAEIDAEVTEAWASQHAS